MRLGPKTTPSQSCPAPRWLEASRDFRQADAPRKQRLTPYVRVRHRTVGWKKLRVVTIPNRQASLLLPRLRWNLERDRNARHGRGRHGLCVAVHGVKNDARHHELHRLRHRPAFANPTFAAQA